MKMNSNTIFTTGGTSGIGKGRQPAPPANRSAHRLDTPVPIAVVGDMFNP